MVGQVWQEGRKHHLQSEPRSVSGHRRVGRQAQVAFAAAMGANERLWCQGNRGRGDFRDFHPLLPVPGESRAAELTSYAILRSLGSCTGM